MAHKVAASFVQLDHRVCYHGINHAMVLEVEAFEERVYKLSPVFVRSQHVERLRRLAQLERFVHKAAENGWLQVNDEIGL